MKYDAATLSIKHCRACQYGVYDTITHCMPSKPAVNEECVILCYTLWPPLQYSIKPKWLHSWNRPITGLIALCSHVIQRTEQNQDHCYGNNQGSKEDGEWKGNTRCRGRGSAMPQKGFSFYHSQKPDVQVWAWPQLKPSMLWIPETIPFHKWAQWVRSCMHSSVPNIRSIIARDSCGDQQILTCPFTAWCGIETIGVKGFSIACSQERRRSLTHIG